MWKYFDGRISRVYERLDEVKKSQDAIYVRKETCSLLHATTADSLKSVEYRMNERFDKLETKVDESFRMILDILRK
jgi:hypothetical protein